jgi:hypothetical protein
VIRVDGLTYYEAKVRAGLFNGHDRGDRLTEAPRQFVGFLSEPRHEAVTRVTAWLPAAARHERIDKQLEELARLRDIAPGWFALAREIVKDE